MINLINLVPYRGEHPDVPRMKLYDEQFRDHKQELDVKLFSLDIVETHDSAHTKHCLITLSDLRNSHTHGGCNNHWRRSQITEIGSIRSMVTSGSNSASQYTVAQVCPQDSREARLLTTSWSSQKHDWRTIIWRSSSLPQDRQIHQAHVKTILDAPPIKEGSGKEIRKLHDTVIKIYVHWNHWNR